MIALEFLRAVESWNDHGWGKYSLHYLRNKEKQEVDFLIAKNNRPILLAEAKLSDDAPAASLFAFQKILNVPAVQLVKKEHVKKVYLNGKNSVLVATAHQWLSTLP